MMYLRTLTLHSFRNLIAESFSFSEKFNVFVGKNAQGKTNIVEAIYLLAFGRSFRTSEYRDLITWGEGEGGVKAEVSIPEGADRWSAKLTLERKQIWRNEKRPLRYRKRGIAAVLFSPEEILLLRNSPEARRRYGDDLISRFVPTHASLVRDYEKVVSHRNHLLKDDTLSRDLRLRELSRWNEPLVRLGLRLVEARKQWSEILNEELAKQYRVLAEQDGIAEFRYHPNCATEREFIEMLDLRMEEEFRRRISLIGPHRDDFIAALDGHPVKHYGSQGQHRSFVLALKVAELELFTAREGATPIFLLDDVASELDEHRNRAFFHYLETTKGQVFITTTDLASLHLPSTERMATYLLQSGKAASL